MLYKPGPQLFIADLLSREYHKTDKEEEIPDMYITINAIVMQRHTRLRENKGIRIATLEDEQPSALEELILCSWPSTKTEVQKELQ